MDELTGLRNRRAMREDFRDWSSSSGPLCVVLMDLNGLKEINDTLGHQTGDTVLRDIAAAIHSDCWSCPVFF